MKNCWHVNVERFLSGTPKLNHSRQLNVLIKIYNALQHAFTTTYKFMICARYAFFLKRFNNCNRENLRVQNLMTCLWASARLCSCHFSGLCICTRAVLTKGGRPLLAEWPLPSGGQTPLVMRTIPQAVFCRLGGHHIQYKPRKSNVVLTSVEKVSGVYYSNIWPCSGSCYLPSWLFMPQKYIYFGFSH